MPVGFTPPPVEEMRAKYPGFKFFDPPRGGLDLCCAHCGHIAWIPVPKYGVIESFPHYFECRNFGKGMSGVFVKSVTGSPFVTVWEEQQA